ncbi:hypothetical protein PROFUN_15036 [Planoprotostelium fungivorum]|uniref:DUF4395 domain-containing protein n=1 Tax=Planoprotostelium fungivorum TaxID=1890364 RepID=A0A2P6MZN2_9EUKA|nr:hypothetical protein PROFUN_15036 [Planoprotostelium fungivorum]
MDPRLSWSDEWTQPLSVFYYAGCIVCVARAVITYSRRGFRRSLDMLLLPESFASGDPRVLKTIELTHIVVLFAYSLCMATSIGTLPRVVFEVLWSLPPALNAGCQGTLSSFLVMVHRASADRLMKPHLLYKKAAIIGGVQTILALSGFISAVVYLHFYPQNGRLSYLISGVPVALIHLTFIVTILHLMRALEKKSSRFRRKIWLSVRFSLLYQLVWLLSFIIYISSYYNVTSITSPAAWMTLVSLQLFSTVSSMNDICTTLSKDQFTPEGIQRLKPKLIITVGDRGSTRNAVIRAVDGNVSRFTSSPTDSKSDSSPNCELGICPVQTVDLATAREMAAPIWRQTFTSWSNLFTFPNPINENDARIHAGIVSVICAVVMIVGAVRADVNCWWLYAYLFFGFSARFIAGPRFDPQAWFIVLFIVPRLDVRPIYVPGPPKRFAQFCGLISCGASLILYVIGLRSVAFWLLGLLLVLSFVQARHGICVGCFIWHLFSLTGFMSKELVVKSTVAFQVQDVKTSAIALTPKSHVSEEAKPQELDEE